MSRSASELHFVSLFVPLASAAIGLLVFDQSGVAPAAVTFSIYFKTRG